MKRLIAACALTCAGLAGAFSQTTEIEFWHAMGGRLGEKVVEICDGFNKTHTNVKIVPVFKGSYAETMTAGIAAYRAGKAPHIMQVFEVGTATMMGAKGAIRPVHQLMAKYNAKFDPKSYLGAVAGYYTDTKGKMLSMPFNSSTPVLYYNKDAFAKAGLDPDKPPKTWPEMAEFSKKLVAAGYSAGFTTTWVSWIMLENLSAWHDLPSGTKSNGFGGTDTELVLNKDLQIRMLQSLADWQKDKIFVYGGRTSAAGPMFLNEQVGMILDSSAGYSGLASNAKFKFGVSMMPYWPDVKGAPRNSIIGGASLWVLNGKPEKDYAGVAAFFDYISKPEIQADWHQFTGYLPITTAAYELTKKQGFYEQKPGTDVSIRQINLNPPTENSKGVRYGNMVQIRDVVDIQVEALFAGKQDAKQTLDEIVKQGNDLLRRFARSNG